MERACTQMFQCTVYGLSYNYPITTWNQTQQDKFNKIKSSVKPTERSKCRKDGEKTHTCFKLKQFQTSFLTWVKAFIYRQTSDNTLLGIGTTQGLVIVHKCTSFRIKVLSNLGPFYRLVDLTRVCTLRVVLLFFLFLFFFLSFSLDSDNIGLRDLKRSCTLK